MPGSEKTGLLLVNLGTPRSPKPSDVRTYLREFLSDPRVLDMPAWRRFLILELFILPTRPRRSGEAYAKIWTDRGSPLMFHSLDLAEKMQQRLGAPIPVALAMRYGQPSIAAGLESLRDRGARRILVCPLYPQYSSPSTGSVLERVFEVAGGMWDVPYLQVVPPFYEHAAFIEACARIAEPYIRDLEPDRVFFSFHGLPERQIRKSDPTGNHCLVRDDCCDRIVDANRHCYRAQCFATARRLAERMKVPAEQCVVCFQSRLGRDPWIRPFTDELIASAPREGCRRAVILSPAFVADCLETLEELGIRAVAAWKAAGGTSLHLVPCLNATDDWVEALTTILRDACAGVEPRCSQVPG